MIRLVADIGLAHQGRIEHAKRLIDICAGAGVTEIKGQVRTLEFMRAHHPRWNEPVRDPRHAYGGTFGEHRQTLELPKEQHLILRDYAIEKSVEYFVSAFDPPAIEWAAEHFETFKVPSACTTWGAYLDTLAATRDDFNDVIVSTGACTIEDVRVASAKVEADYLLQCTSTYPTPSNEVNLDAMGELAAFAPHIGVSGHWREVSEIDCAAIGVGAEMVERHVGFSRYLPGTDNALSLEPDDIPRWAKACRVAWESLGNGRKRVIESEAKAAGKLREGMK